MSQWTSAKKIYAMCQSLSRLRGGSPLLYFLDAAYCGYRHGASPENYFVLRFFAMKDAERRKYLTSGRSKSADRELNRQAYVEDRQILGSKALFNRVFSGLVNREYVYAPESEFAAFDGFLSRHDECILKPSRGLQGKGIEKLRTGQVTDRAALFQRCAEDRLLLEEPIAQHPALALVNASSLNSVRINAARDTDGQIRLIGACLKCGLEGAVSDNFHAGGIAYPLDLETGRITGPGRNNRDLNEYIHHPGSLVFMPGFQVPYWPSVVDYVRRGMDIVSSVGYVGWDVAVTPEGPELIEGNYSWPGGNIIQFDKIGKYPLILECLGKEI